MSSSLEPTSWCSFLETFQWKQGEHIAAIAPTGAGKTTLMEALVPLRKYSIFFGTKPDDPLYRRLISKKGGFTRVESFSEIRPWHNKIMLWPRQRDTIRATESNMASQFRIAFDSIVKQKAWTAWLDECKYMAEGLGLRRELTYCLEQLRSIKGTTISGAQRPVWLPRSVLANSSHVFLWRTTDREDAKRLSDIGGIDARQLAQEAQQLDKHEMIYVYTRGTESRMVRTQVGKEYN
jgi:hypothetical protein